MVPLKAACTKVECDESIVRCHSENGIVMPDQVGRYAFVSAELPSERTSPPIDRVRVPFRHIGVEDNQILGDDGIAVKARVLIRSRVERPGDRASILVERIKEAGTGSDEQLIPNDRWGDGESAAGFVLPEEFERL